MVVLHTCKNEEDPIKNEDARVLTLLYTMRHKFSNFHLIFKMQIGMKMK